MIGFSELSTSSHVSKEATLEHPVHISPRVQVSDECIIGMFSFLNMDTVIYPHVNIGRYCSVARNCEIGVAAHPTSLLSTHSFQYHKALFPKLNSYQKSKRSISFRAHPNTIIGNDVWIGAKVIIKSGINVSDGAIIAANSFVTKDVPAYSIVGGSPAKIIKYRFDHHIIIELLNLKWWDLPYEKISELPFDNIEKCIFEIKKIIYSENNLMELDES